MIGVPGSAPVGDWTLAPTGESQVSNAKTAVTEPGVAPDRASERRHLNPVRQCHTAPIRGYDSPLAGTIFDGLEEARSGLPRFRGSIVVLEPARGLSCRNSIRLIDRDNHPRDRGRCGPDLVVCAFDQVPAQTPQRQSS